MAEYNDLALADSVKDLYAGDSAYNTTIHIGGVLNVNGGSLAEDTKIYGGTQFVFSGGSAANTAIGISSVQNVYGGSATNTTIAGGLQVVRNGGVACGTRIYVGHDGGTDGGVQQVYDGGVAIGTTLEEYAEQHVSSGGLASGTTINIDGSQYVSDGGSAVSTTVLMGVQEVTSGGIAVSTTVTGDQTVYQGGTVISTTLLDGGWQGVIGVASATTISEHCTQEVLGMAYDTTISAGGVQWVGFGADTASAVDTVVLDGGLQRVGKNGVAIATAVSSGGTLRVTSAGRVENATIARGGVLQITGEGTAAAGTITLAGTLDANYAADMSAASITLDVTDRNTDDGYMVNDLSRLSGASSWTVSVGPEQSYGNYKLAGNASGFSSSIRVAFPSGASAGAISLSGNSVDYRNRHYALTLGGDDGLCLSVSATDPSSIRPAALAYSTGDAKLNTGVGKALASGVSITQAAVDAVNARVAADGGYGRFSLSGRNLVFTQTRAYTHASGSDIARHTYSFAMTDGNSNSTTQDVTVSIADSTPTLSVAAFSASVPSGTAKSGTWSHSFGADVPGTKTVTVGGKSLAIASGKSVAVAGTCGTLTVKADGTYSYKANPNAAGTDSFAFKITDADGDSKSATLKVTAVDKTAPELTGMTPAANAVGAAMQFSEKMNAASIKSALKATLTGTGATVKPTAVKETNATSHIYSATFAATPYVGAYKLTLGTGAKDVAGNAVTQTKTVAVNMKVTGKTLGAKAKQMIYAGGTAVKSVINKGGTLTLNKGGVANALKLAAGGKVQLNGGSLTGTTTLNGGTMTVAARSIKVAKITAKTAAVVKYDVSKLKTGTAAMLAESTKQALNTGFSIVTAKAQQIGSYRLSTNLNVTNGKAFTIYQGTTKLGTTKLGGTALKKSGVNYTVSQSGSAVTLKLSVAAGKMFKGNDRANAQKGTAHSDIFYGGKGNDTITGVNGRDVAVYDKKAWGRDTIAATKGTMTLVLAGLKQNTHVTQKLSGTTMTLTRKGTSDKITIKGWNAATHNILYNVAASKLKAFNTYLNAASPTEAQKKAAQNSVFKAAKLA